MKISKLFHWLYAILMLLPFLVFLPNAFYYGFNEHAVAQEKTEQIPSYYETNEVNTIDDLHLNHIYYWNDNYTNTYNVDRFLFSIYLTENIKQLYPSQTADMDNVEFFYSNQHYCGLRLSNETITRYIILNNVSLYFVIKDYSVNFNWTTNIIDHITSYNGLVENGLTQPLTTDMSITDSMSYAWDSVWQNDLFSWSYGSFLTEPFIYIGNVFNVPNDNSLYYALSYWLDISIIWLCFDLVMYIPLLVHRWLDKGIIE